ncbi:MAG TPA: hypothetical protein VL977_04890 [Solirubrobacteraceae bacterium]|nr:hypothetical protein [Solirubrobacteraceae bacterium]
MLAVPLICPTLVAIAIAPGAQRALARGPLAARNHRGRTIAAPLGLPIVAAALAGLALAAALGGTAALAPAGAWAIPFACGAALLGLVDDALGRGVHGWRAHAAALRTRRPDSGALKALGVPLLALGAMVLAGGGAARVLLGVGVLTLATHAVNLVDLRPGRAVKLLALLATALALASGTIAPLRALAPFAGPILVAGWLDLRERGMLGDCGAALLGAVAGIWLVLSLSLAGLAIALAALAALAVYGEFRSISALVDRAPLLRHLDWVGRPHDALEH